MLGTASPFAVPGIQMRGYCLHQQVSLLERSNRDPERFFDASLTAASRLSVGGARRCGSFDFARCQSDQERT